MHQLTKGQIHKTERIVYIFLEITLIRAISKHKQYMWSFVENEPEKGHQIDSAEQHRSSSPKTLRSRSGSSGISTESVNPAVSSIERSSHSSFVPMFISIFLYASNANNKSKLKTREATAGCRRCQIDLGNDNDLFSVKL